MLSNLVGNRRLRAGLLAAVPPSIAQRLQFAIKEPSRRRWARKTGNSEIDAIISRIDEAGFALIDNYLSPAECANAIDEIDRACIDHPEAVHCSDDDRIYGIEQASPVAASVAHDRRWIEIAEAYSGEPFTSLFILGNRLVPRVGQVHGSGGGWHRDCFARELKVLIYLTDVEDENGIFRIILGSHTNSQILSDMSSAGLRALQNRITDAEVATIIAAEPSRDIRVAAKAGTAIVFDNSSIHCGSPIVSGKRYALTNYLAPVRHATRSQVERYSPVLRKPGR